MQQGITTTGHFEVARVDKLSLSLELKKFKHENGTVNFAALRDIPVEQRMYALAKKDLGMTVKLVAVAITLAMESMNLTRPMNAIQILDLAEVVIEESESDKLSIQDLLIFLQKLTRGHYPGLYEGMDSLKFLERFNQYRDERWDEMRALRDAKDEEYKAMGDSNHHQRHNPKDTSAFGQMMEQYRTKAQIQRDERRERRNYDH